MAILNARGAGDAGVDEEHFAFFRRVKVHPEGGLGSGSDDSHFASEDIEESGEFVKLCPAKQASDRGNARVILGGHGGPQVVGVSDHGAEFDHSEGSSTAADALPFEENGAGRRGFDGDSEQQDQRRKQE